MEVRFPNGTSIYDARNFIFETMEESFKKEVGIVLAIDREKAMMSFSPDCGCESFSMRVADIPLEDLSCPCGKTKLIRMIWE